MNRVLITGGAGFIGSSLVTALMLSKNCQVTVLDNLSRGSKKNISRWLDSPNFQFVQADLLDYSSPSHKQESLLQKAVDRSDIIFHLAANPDVAIGAENTQIDFQQNIQATYNLLEAIRKSQVFYDQTKTKGNNKNNKQLVFASTSTVYGEANKRPTQENYSPLCPISLYGATKLACEAIISGYCYMFGIQCVVARLANIIGPTNNHGVIYDFVAKLSSHPDYLDILGNGQQNKSYLYIDDCVNALVLLSESMRMDFGDSELENNGNGKNLTDRNSKSNNMLRTNGDGHYTQPSFKVYNIGSDDTITVLQIAQIVINQLSLRSKKVRKVFTNNFEDGRGWKGDVPEFWLDCSKLKGVGWKLKFSVSKDAVVQTCKEYLKAETRKRNHLM